MVEKVVLLLPWFDVIYWINFVNDILICYCNKWHFLLHFFLEINHLIIKKIYNVIFYSIIMNRLETQRWSRYSVRQPVEKYKEKKKKLCIMFIHLEKAYYRVPKEVLK